MFTCEPLPMLTARRRSASAEPNRGGRVCRPGLTVANCSPTVESAATSRFPLSTGTDCWHWNHSPGDQCPTLGLEGWLQP